jgi:cyclophilin family peptidyl-prolyl cis-trans isomerase
MKYSFQLLVVALVIFAAGCGNAQPSAEATDGAAQTSDTINRKSGNEEALVRIITDFGTITIKLYNETPLHRDNFLKLARQGFYDSLLFHRVINGFMIQGGDPDSKKAAPGAVLGNGEPGYTIPAEFRTDLIHKKGALAAARMPDQMNPAKASSGSQFYLVQGKVYTLEELKGFEQRFGITFTQKQIETYTTVGGTPHLDGGYTVFGEVIDGISVIDKIAAQKTGANDRPVKDIRMKVEIIKDIPATK